MNIEELEEALDEFLPPGWSLEINKHGQVVILTNLRRDEDSELHPIANEDTDEDFDPDFDPLEQLEEDEDE
jgi:hypothetical protein